MVDSISVTILAAGAAAVSFALTGMLQHRATERAPRRRALHPSLLYDLARQPLWLLSIGAALIGFGLQAAALRLGPLALVQPIIAMQILVAPMLAAAVYHRQVDRELLFGAVLCLLGLSTFLVAGDPSGGPSPTAYVRAPSMEASPSTTSLLSSLVAVGVVVAVIRRLSSPRRGWSRSIVLALGAGTLYGVTAGLLKVTVEHIGQGGWTDPLTTWSFYAMLVAGPVGFLLNQNAFQAGPFVAPLAVIMVTDPIVAIGIGLMWLNERISATPGAIVAGLTGLAAMVVGIAVLAHRTSRTTPRTAPVPGHDSEPSCRSCPA